MTAFYLRRKLILYIHTHTKIRIALLFVNETIIYIFLHLNLIPFLLVYLMHLKYYRVYFTF